MSRDAESSRLAIIMAVWRLIARGGIEAVTFRRVAEVAEVSAGRVQHHFCSREQLVRAACVAMIEGAHDQYEQLPDDPLQRIGHLLTHAVPDSEQTRFGTSVWYAYLAKSVDDVEIGRLLADTKRGTEDECIRLIELAGAPAHDSDDARSAARRLLALADGLTVRVLVGDLSGSAARELLDSELAGLGSVGSENPLRPSPRPGTARAG